MNNEKTKSTINNNFKQKTERKIDISYIDSDTKRYYYCVLDFNLFRSDPGIKAPGLIELITHYNLKFPNGRLPVRQQRHLLDTIKMRLDNTPPLTFLRLNDELDTSASVVLNYRPKDSNEVKPFSVSSESLGYAKLKQKFGDRLIELFDNNTLINSPVTSVFLNVNGIDVVDTTRRITNRYFSLPNQVLPLIEDALGLTDFKMDNWINIPLGVYTQGVDLPRSPQFSLWFKCYNPSPSALRFGRRFGVVQLFNKLGVRQAINDVVIKSNDKFPLYNIIDIFFTSPTNLDLKNDDNSNETTNVYLGPAKRCSISAIVHKHFLLDKQEGIEFSLPRDDIRYIVSMNLSNSCTPKDVFAFSVAMCLKLKFSYAYTSPAYSDMVSSSINRLHSIMAQAKHIFIAAAKGSGKSFIKKIVPYDFLYIDSDVYGVLLNELSKTDVPDVNDDMYVPFMCGKLLELISLTEEEFNTKGNAIEYAATEFIKQKSLTLGSIISGAYSNHLYQHFSRILTEFCSRIMTRSKFAEIVGFLPHYAHTINSVRYPSPPRIIEFAHNSWEMFTAMSNNFIVMEASYDPLAAVLTRSGRQSTIEAQVFLAKFYTYLEPYLPMAYSSYVVYEALTRMFKSSDELEMKPYAGSN